MLANYNKLVKELGYVSACIEHTVGETAPEVQGTGDSDPTDLGIGRVQPDATTFSEGLLNLSAS
jgi:hypothetical protein